MSIADEIGCVELGEKVKDTITGFTGITVGRVEYLYGCEQYQVEGIDHDKQPASFWFDTQRLQTITKRKYKAVEETVRRGGPRDTPTGRSHPETLTKKGD